jgi:tetratricopeptide (TPR) repeat protein
VRREVVYELEYQLQLVSDGDLSALVSAGRSFLARYPELTGIVPILLERGDPAGRSFAIRGAAIGQTPELLSALRDFVFSRYGPDLIRIQATEVLLQTEWLQPGSHQMWVKGRWEESLIMGAVIDGEPIRNVGEKARPLSDKALYALRAGDGLKAEGLLRQALLIEPDNPMLIHNLLSSLSLQGRTEEVEELAEKLHRQFPEYFFGRTNMAMLAIQKGELDRAGEYLKPLYSRRHFHFSEYRSFASVQIKLALARGDRKTARQWLENWERIDPDNRELERFRIDLLKYRSNSRPPSLSNVEPTQSSKRKSEVKHLIYSCALLTSHEERVGWDSAGACFCM